MKVRLLSPANVEPEEAARHYDQEIPGLGVRFLDDEGQSALNDRCRKELQ